LPSPLLVVGLLAGAIGVAPAVAQGNAGACVVPVEEYDKATRTILCDCGCHPQSVHDCACGRASEMRAEIRQEMQAGCLSGDELISMYVARHGDQIRIAPTASGFNLVAWLGPMVALFAATAVMFGILRRWSRSHRPVAAAEIPVLLAEDDPYRDRLRQALEKME